ncbi:hypothetical protein M378DRAFT_737331 [Amanita muscaria Koide BX008]|uniref:Serine-threonine/tyrosine-protein kinase catalytic domain-containing protein n=1 Tax=Amanita muscaria (strain Koide BX008) TaxID=946122 RepID=A0A0C2X2V5_AMAMK|nr:hypothetical protein M378DRAFT_737331 [Amanita muscaria Koide BX008]
MTRLSAEEVHQRNIFILGCTFYELYFNVELEQYRDIIYQSQFEDDMIQLQGPEPPSEPEISDELWQVIRRCYAADPKSRPTIQEVVQEMESWKID